MMATQLTSSSAINRAALNLKAKKASMFLPLKSNSIKIGDYDDSGISISNNSTANSPNSFISNKSIILQNSRKILNTNVPTFKPSANVVKSIYSPVSPISPQFDQDYEFEMASTPINRIGKSIWSPNQTLSSIDPTISNGHLARSRYYSTSSSYSNSNCSSSFANECPICPSCCSFSSKSKKIIKDDNSMLSTSDDRPSSEEFEALIDMAENVLKQHLQNLSMTASSLCNSSGSNSSSLVDTKFCKFCKSNNEPREFYLSHSTRNEKGEVVCPILQNYRCPLCTEKGHTRSYCTYSQIIRNGVEDYNITYEFYNMGSLKGTN